MHLKGFGRGQRFVDEATEALAESIVETFGVICRPRFG